MPIRFERLRLPALGENLVALLQEWARPLNDLLNDEFQRGTILDVTLVNGTASIAHGLGRIPQGFLATGTTSGATPTIVDPGGHTDRLLYVECNAATSARLYVW